MAMLKALPLPWTIGLAVGLSLAGVTAFAAAPTSPKAVPAPIDELRPWVAAAIGFMPPDAKTVFNQPGPSGGGTKDKGGTPTDGGKDKGGTPTDGGKDHGGTPTDGGKDHGGTPTNATPEPTTFLLGLTGLGSTVMIALRRRRR